MILKAVIADKQEASSIYDGCSDDDHHHLRDLFNTLRLLVKSYFVEKKRIFAGWEKYPNCYPPVHKEVQELLEDIEIRWSKIIDRLPR